MSTPTEGPEPDSRRDADRRQGQAKIDFADRRQDDRRRGKDRRASPRG